jgi:hypothetical protein
LTTPKYYYSQKENQRIKLLLIGRNIFDIMPTMTDSQPNNDFDSPWKESIEKFFPAFMSFFFPEITQEIDWSKPVEFLDKELEKVTIDAELGRRYADKLVKVQLLNGDSKCVLVHIEIQAKREAGFTERIYVYRHRIWERYRLNVSSLVIYVDGDPNYHPSEYKTECWGTKLHFEFPYIKLLDYVKDWAKLESNDNPFSLVVMAHLKAKEIKNGQERKKWKLYLTQLLSDRDYSREDSIDLFRFIEWLLVLPTELEKEFQKELENMGAKQMAYVTSYERAGIQTGIQQGEAKIFLNLLKLKFGEVTQSISEKIESADSDQIMRWSNNLLNANSVDDIFKQLNQ